MRDLSEFSKKKPDNTIEIDIEMTCSQCFNEVKTYYFLRRDKLLIAYCEEGHETKIEGFTFI